MLARPSRTLPTLLWNRAFEETEGMSLPFGHSPRHFDEAIVKAIRTLLTKQISKNNIYAEHSAAWFSAFDWGAKGREFESPCSDHRFSHSPSMAYPLAGCFVSANLLKLRHLCGFSVCGIFPAEKEEKTVADVSPDVFPPFFSV